MKNRFFVLLWANLILLYPNSAVHADDKTDDRVEKAAAAFMRGIELFDKGEYREASAEFRKANELKSNWKLQYNIGQCEASSKRYGLALEAFESYLAQAGDDIELARRDEVLSEIQRLKLMVGSLDIEAPEGAEVYINAELRGTMPLAGPILIPSGIPHQVDIKKEDRLLLSTQIKLSSGQTRTVSVNSDESTLQTTSEAPGQGSTAESDSSENRPKNKADRPTDSDSTAKKHRNVPAIVLLAAGGTALAAGVVTGSIALKRGNQLESDYPDGVPLSEEDRMNSVDHLALATDILLGVGAVSAVIGAILLIRTKRESRVTASPSIGPNMSGVVLKGRF